MEFILVGDFDSGGAIATIEQFEDFELSYAYLYSDGVIKRFNVPIGTKDDIEVIGTYEM